MSEPERLVYRSNLLNHIARGSDQSDQDGKNDLERAQRNLQRALAIDDSYMPAFNQLAVYYLEQAKADGRWDAAYDSPKTATVPEDLAAATVTGLPAAKRLEFDALLLEAAADLLVRK